MNRFDNWLDRVSVSPHFVTAIMLLLLACGLLVAIAFAL